MRRYVLVKRFDDKGYGGFAIYVRPNLTDETPHHLYTTDRPERAKQWKTAAGALRYRDSARLGWYFRNYQVEEIEL